MFDLTDLSPNAPVVLDALATLNVPRPRPVHRSIIDARASIERTLRDTLRLSDDALPLAWRWRGQDKRVDVRYGLYRLFEILEEATVTAMGVVAHVGARQGDAGRILGQATQARWDLHGLVLPLSTADFDRPPGGQEWTLRETLAHMAMTQSRYTLNTAFWAFATSTGDGTPRVVPDTPLTEPNAASWSAGTGIDILGRLDAMLDIAVGLLGDLDDAARLESPGMWVGYDVTVRFRLQRFAAHLREHTIQIEKTLEMLGRQPREIERIARIILGAYGRLEATILCLPNDTLDQEFDASRSLAGLLEETASEFAAIASTLHR